MSERLQYSIDELTLASGMKNNLGNWTLKWGTAVPSAVGGYAIGGLFSNTSTGKLYQNVGTAASCTFNAIGDIIASEISLTNGSILAGNASGVAAAVTPSGVVTMTNAGVFSLTTAASPFANTIADPGTGVAIPVTASGVCSITTAAAETNTLANPPSVGMIIALNSNVWAVGSRVITVASGINVAGNTAITLPAVGTSIVLYSVLIAGVPRWRVMSNDGATLA